MGMGMGMTWWEWEGMRNPHLPICSQRNRTSPSVVLHQLLRELQRTLDCHSPPAKKRRVFDFKDLCGPEDDQQQSRNELAEYVNLDGNGSGRKWELPIGMGIKLG